MARERLSPAQRATLLELDEDRYRDAPSCATPAVLRSLVDRGLAEFVLPFSGPRRTALRRCLWSRTPAGTAAVAAEEGDVP